MRTSSRFLYWLRVGFSTALFGVAAACSGSDVSIQNLNASGYSLLLIELTAESEFQNLELIYQRFHFGRNRPGDLVVHEDVTIAGHLTMAKGESKVFSVITPQYDSGDSKLYADCVTLRRGSSLMNVVTFFPTTDKEKSDNRDGIKGICESENQISGMDIQIKDRLPIGDSFKHTPTINEAHDNYLVIDSTGIVEGSQASDMLTNLINSEICHRIVRPISRYYICKKIIFRVDTEFGRILVSIDEPRQLVAEIPSYRNLTDYRHRPLHLHRNAGWRSWLLESDEDCNVPGRGFSIIYNQHSTRAFLHSVTSDKRALYLPDEEAVIAHEDRLKPFAPELSKEESSLWIWGSGTYKTCLKLSQSRPKITLEGDRGKLINDTSPEWGRLMSQEDVRRLTDSLRKWALGYTDTGTVRIQPAFSDSSEVVPLVDDGGSTFILSGVDWHRFELTGRSRGGPFSFSGWSLEGLPNSPHIILDEEGSVASYRLHGRKERKFNVVPPSERISIDYGRIDVSVTISPDELTKNRIISKVIEVDLEPVKINLKPSVIYGIVPILQIDLHDGTIIDVVGEAGLHGIVNDSITIRPQIGNSCPNNSSEITNCFSRDTSSCHRLCRIESRNGQEPEYEIDVMSLKTVTPVGLSTVNRSTLSDRKMKKSFVELFLNHSHSPLKERKVLFRKAFNPGEHGVDLHVEPNARVVVRTGSYSPGSKNRCEIIDLQTSSVSSSFRIGNGYERSRLQVWSEGRWKAISDVQDQTARISIPKHAYLLVGADGFLRDTESSDRRRGSVERRMKFSDILGANFHNNALSETANEKLDRFRSRWSRQSDDVFDYLKSIEIESVSFHAAYTNNDGALAFKPLGSQINIRGSHDQRLQFRKMHEHIYKGRHDHIFSSNHLRFIWSCRDPHCLSLEFQRYLLEDDCDDLRPLSRLFILTEMDSERSPRIGASSLLEACAVQDFASSDTRMDQLFERCELLK